MKVIIPQPILADDPKRRYPNFLVTEAGDEWLLNFPRPAATWSANSRDHHMVVSRRKRIWRESPALIGKGFTTPQGSRWAVRVSFPVRDRRRRDPHNLTGTCVKAIIDGLTDAGWWPDDTPEWVEVLDPTFRLVAPPDPMMVWVHGLKLVDNATSSREADHG